MNRKVFYFVRHGESILNSQGIRQAAEGSLSENGIAQAKITGERLANYTIETIIASPYTRTRETADIINSHFKHPKKIEYNDLLKERRNPTEIVGKSIKDPEVKKIIDMIDKSYHDNNSRFSDEENFNDLKERAKKLLDYLATRPEKRVLIVTHGIFLRMIAAYILYGDELTASTYNLLSFWNRSTNASITICEYKKGWFGPPKDKRWSLIAWDDYIKDDSIKHESI